MDEVSLLLPKHDPILLADGQAGVRKDGACLACWKVREMMNKEVIT